MGKYIIELPDDENLISWWVYTGTEDGKQHIDFREVVKTPYTEPDLDAIHDEAYEKGVQDTKQHLVDAPRTCAYKLGYESGLNNAWETARQVSNMTLKTQKTIFDVEGTRYVVRKYTVQEAMERIKNYENEKPEEYKFTPGDEIVYKTDHSIRVCVTSVNVGSWNGFALADVEDVCTFGGSYLDRPFEDWEKTGRKVEILKKAKEE